MSRPNYRVVISFDSERKTFTARVPELAHCTAEGTTRAEAMTHIEQEIDALIANLHAQGKTAPAAIDDAPPSGELTVKVSKGLHRELLWQAATDGVDLNQLAAELLSAGLDGRRGSPKRRPQADGNQAPEPRGRHHDGGGGGDRRRGGMNQGGHMIEDRAHFMEYLRNLEHDSRRAPHQRDDRRGGEGQNKGRGGGPRHGQGRDRGRPHGAPSGDHGAPTGNSERGS